MLSNEIFLAIFHKRGLFSEVLTVFLGRGERDWVSNDLDTDRQGKCFLLLDKFIMVPNSLGPDVHIILNFKIGTHRS